MPWRARSQGYTGADVGQDRCMRFMARPERRIRQDPGVVAQEEQHAPAPMLSGCPFKPRRRNKEQDGGP
eukprot:563982-Pyramimonas_sp.AAC.1